MRKLKSKTPVYRIPKGKNYILFILIGILLFSVTLLVSYHQSLPLSAWAQSNTKPHITLLSNTALGQDVEIVLFTDAIGDAYAFDLDCGNGKKGREKGGKDLNSRRQEFICRYDTKGIYTLHALVKIQPYYVHRLGEKKYFDQRAYTSVPITYGVVVFDTPCGNYSQMCCGKDGAPTKERCISGLCVLEAFPLCGRGKVSLALPDSVAQKGYAEVNTAIPVSLDTTVFTDSYNYYLDCNTDGIYEFEKENVKYNGYFGNAQTGDFACVYENPGIYTVSGYVSVLDGSGISVKLIPSHKTIEIRGAVSLSQRHR